MVVYQIGDKVCTEAMVPNPGGGYAMVVKCTPISSTHDGVSASYLHALVAIGVVLLIVILAWVFKKRRAERRVDKLPEAQSEVIGHL